MLYQYRSSGGGKMTGIDMVGIGYGTLGTDVRAQAAGKAMAQVKINHLSVPMVAGH